MDGVQVINGSTYIHDDDAWISYYTKKRDNTSVVTEPVKSVVVNSAHTLNIPINQDCQAINKVSTSIKKTPEVMQDIELVSPVQGAVQQARAQYARADPIKRRRVRKRQSKKGKRRTRKKVKKPRKRLKVTTLKKKQYKKKRKIRKKRSKRRPTKKKRDIFSD
jgi:hypothetical protein